MLHRLRARQRHTNTSGLASWCRDQMAVRYGQAVHINPDTPNEEAPVNMVADLGDGTTLFACDLPLMDEAAAVDALATLSDLNVLGQSLTIDDDMGEGSPSWVEHHLCDHDEPSRSGCTVVGRNVGPA